MYHKMKSGECKMHYIWLGLAMLCVAYYIICAAYAGPGSSFIFIWLAAAFLFGGIFFIRVLEIRNGLIIPKGLERAFIVLFTVGISLFLVLEAMIIVNMINKPDEDCEYIIVLGCQIRGSHITKSLRKRLERALTYAEENEDVCIIVSGGQGPDEDMSEAQAMYQYLTSNGIAAERIFMEDQSVNTNENIQFSLAYIDDPNAKVGIVTSDFHILRAKLIAKAKGLSNVCGIASPSDEILIYNYMVRESVGIVKDFLVGNFFH